MYIETQRLVLKPFSEADMDDLCKLLRDDIIKKTYMLPDFESDEHCLKLARRLRDLSLDESRYVVGIYLDGKLIGFSNDVENVDGAIEMGYVIDPAHHNCGYATEAMTGIISCLHGQGFREVIAGAFECNPASIRVMQKSGMTLVDKIDEIEYRGKVHRCVYYVAKNINFSE